MNALDFNDAPEQTSFTLIPKGTLAKVRMTLKPGGYDDPNQGWTGGYATHSEVTGAVYLMAEFVILEGEYAKRKLWSNIGLYSPKGPEWGNMGRTFIRALLNSSRNIKPDDMSPQAQAARRIAGFSELDGIDCVAVIDVEKDSYQGQQTFKNVIKQLVEPNDQRYGAIMHGQALAVSQPSYATAAPATKPITPAGNKPAWA